METDNTKTNRQQQKLKTRKTIKQVAKRAFAENGIEATNTREISAKAGVAVGTFFSHYPDKMSLVKEIFFEEMDANLTSRLHHFLSDENTTPCEFLAAFSTALFDFYLAHRDYSVTIIGQSVLEKGFFQTQLQSMYENIVQRFCSINVDSTSAQIFAENMIANFQYVLLEMFSANSANKTPWLHRLSQLNLPFDHIYQNALKRFEAS